VIVELGSPPSGVRKVLDILDEATSTVVLEYASQGKVVATGEPYSNRYISVITLIDRKISHWRDYLDPLRVITALNAQH
jgi:ketosteroid isomerase-like protein